MLSCIVSTGYYRNLLIYFLKNIYTYTNIKDTVKKVLTVDVFLMIDKLFSFFQEDLREINWTLLTCVLIESRKNEKKRLCTLF